MPETFPTRQPPPGRERLLGTARPVSGIGDHKRVVGCNPRRNALAHNIREMRGVEDGKIRFLRDKQVAFVVTLPILKGTELPLPHAYALDHWATSCKL